MQPAQERQELLQPTEVDRYGYLRLKHASKCNHEHQTTLVISHERNGTEEKERNNGIPTPLLENCLTPFLMWLSALTGEKVYGNLYSDQIVYSYDPAPPAGKFREVIKLKLSKV